MVYKLKMKNIIPLILILVATSCSRRTEYVITPGERIHHDDFEYSATEVIVTRFIKNGSDTLFAKGMFYLVRFKVENRARRVNHEWDNSIAYITDERAGEFENVPSVQQFYDKAKPFGWKENYITTAGSSDSTCLAFDLPFTVTMPYMKVRGSILMGDIFDGALFRRVRIKLY
jgi:hypothetical protein